MFLFQDSVETIIFPNVPGLSLMPKPPVTVSVHDWQRVHLQSLYQNLKDFNCLCSIDAGVPFSVSIQELRFHNIIIVYMT